MSPRRSLLQRFAENPILTAGDWPYTVNAVFNPGVTVGPDGETVLLVRVEERTGISHLTVARSLDGLRGWVVDRQPSFLPDLHRYEEAWGIEDPRITRVDDEYLITYTGFSRGGPLVCLAATRDFHEFERRTVLMPPEDKDAALFPVRFGGRWGLVHRPASRAYDLGAHIWISWSPDLRHWGDHTIVINSRQGGPWDSRRVGLGPPPIPTADGWLVIFHGVKETVAGAIYRTGLALLDTEDPTRVKVRGDEWVFGPEEPYEQIGDVHGVVFPTGFVLEPDGDAIRLYYGAADTCVAMAQASIGELLDYLYGHCVCRRPHRPGDYCDVAGTWVVQL